MDRLVIGITGVKESGKSTSTDYILKNLSHYGATEFVLAGKLKQVCAEAFEIPLEHTTSQKYKEVPFDEPKNLTKEKIMYILEGFGRKTYQPFENDFDLQDKVAHVLNKPLKSPREIMQIVGTELLRNVLGEDVHCNQFNLESSMLHVISDVRFFNEFNFFHSKYGDKFIPIYIQNSNAESKVTENSHQSEKEVLTLKQYCNVIENNGSFKELYEQLDKLIIEKVGM
jgi:hypothetical protein